MEALQALLSNLNYQVLKEPRGFMKILQFIFVICAFATTCSFSTYLSFDVSCQNVSTSTVKQMIEYNFRLDYLVNKFDICGKSQILYLNGDFSSDSGFFVAVGVLSFIFVLGALALYCFANPIYENNNLFPIVDCGVHIIFSVLWLAASSAWASSLSNLKSATSFDSVFAENPAICSGGQSCTEKQEPVYSKLSISILLGFLDLFLFACNVWFVYKETNHFKERQEKKETDGVTVPGV